VGCARRLYQQHLPFARLGCSYRRTAYGFLHPVARAQQPAALSTTLLIATGSMQRLQDGPIIMIAILLMTAVGEPLRRWRMRDENSP